MRPLNSETTQKYESFAWETVIAPAPIAMQTSVACSGVSKPSTVSNGAMMPAVVIIATVEEPCAVLSTAASRNGKKIPIPPNTSACAEMYFTMSEVAITLPSTPPAAVMKRMGPTVMRLSLQME